jgi:nitrite reductase/ring-hydroxylating ferredoxin subunit
VHTTESKKVLIKIAGKSDLPAPGKVKEFLAGGRFICVANVDGEICATDNVCPHWGGPLGQGTIENGKLVCPWHRWPYDLKTGATSRRADVRLTIIKVRIQGDDVFVEL